MAKGWKEIMRMKKKAHWIETSIQRLIRPVSKSEQNQKEKRKIKQY